jgi:hypothetical protein
MLPACCGQRWLSSDNHVACLDALPCMQSIADDIIRKSHLEWLPMQLPPPPLMLWRTWMVTWTRLGSQNLPAGTRAPRAGCVHVATAREAVRTALSRRQRWRSSRSSGRGDCLSTTASQMR